MNSTYTSPKVTAIVVTYQSAQTLQSILTSMQRCLTGPIARCVFVDNGSNDDTPKILAEHTHWAEIVLTGVNGGFGQGCNIGYMVGKRLSASPYTLFINPDAEIEPASVKVMVDFLEANTKVGIVGPATVCGSEAQIKSLQKTHRHPRPRDIFLAALPRIFKNRGDVPIVPGAVPFKTGWVCGAVFMIRTELLDKLGGFDPNFFLYWEEADICRRALNVGYETWALGTAEAKHICGASSDDSDETRVGGCIAQHYYQSRRYYMLKHFDWFSVTIAEIGELCVISIFSVMDLVRGRSMKRMRRRLQAPLFSLPKTNNGVKVVST